VTASRGVGQLIEKQLRARPDLVAATRDLAIKVSGCPNGCSQHHIAGIGLQGSARKLDGKAIPQYFVLVGGGTNEDNTARFGRLAAKIPARRVPAAFERLVELFKAEGAPGETATAFFARVPVEKVKATLADLAEISAATAKPDDYIDPGEDHAFVPETSEGECAA
jgi:sulfite reductase (NADPH) hemoprotein beta-component